MLLVGNEQIATELTRLLVGLDPPRHGLILLNGKPPYRSPGTRAACVSVQSVERRAPGRTVRSMLTHQSQLFEIGRNGVDCLASFGLEHLVDRAHDSLSAQERRQLAFATAIARRDIEFAVFCEPRLDLTAAQLAKLQDYMSELANRACVVCITTSLHDARQLGGPHAQLSRTGWSWVSTGAEPGSRTRLMIEGTGLPSLAAHLAAQEWVSELRMRRVDSELQRLHVSADAGSEVTCQIARVARQNHAKIGRICTEESLMPEQVAERERLSQGAAQAVSDHSQHCNLGRMVWDSLRELLARTLPSSRGALLLLGAPVLTASYAVGQRQLIASEEALQNTLRFFATYIVPLGALLAVRVLNAEPALGGLVEPLARLGASRRIVVSANAAVICVLSAVVAVLSVTVGVLFSAGRLSADLGVCAWIAALGATSYTSIFLLIEQLRHRWLQWLYLLGDMALGASALGVSALFPHAHLLNLLGLSGPLDRAQWFSSVCLAAFVVLAYGLTLIRSET